MCGKNLGMERRRCEVKAAERVLSVSNVARELGLPGPWTVRRLEARRVLPPARRAVLSGDRYYLPDDVQAMRARLMAGADAR